MKLEIDYKLFSFGGNGGETIMRLRSLGFSTERLYYFDTDKQALNGCDIENKFQIGVDLLKGKGTIGNRTLGSEAFKADTGIFDNLVREDCLYVILGGLGGGTFSGMVSHIADLLFKHNRRLVFIASYPFSFEEHSRQVNAIDTIKEINHYTDKLILSNPILWDEADIAGRQVDRYYKMSLQLAEIVVNLLKEDFDGEKQPLNRHQEKLSKAIELVRAYIHKKEYLVSPEDSRIVVARNLKSLLQAFREGVDITRNISPRKFERLVSYIYQVSGHETELTKATRDNGVDIKVFSLPPIKGDPFVTIVQTKQHAPHIKVGESAIRDLAGTVVIQKADRGQLVTNSDFSSPAYKAAKIAKIDLIKFYELAQDVKNLHLT